VSVYVCVCACMHFFKVDFAVVLFQLILD